MADNLTLNAGTGGSTLWTDEIPVSLKHAQVVKLADGTADSATVIASGGGVEAGALRVTLASDSTGVVSVDDNGGAITVDWAGTAPPIGAGVEATALRVTLATDSTGVVSVDDDGASLTVDNAALSVTGGGVEASALRVTLASDSTGVLSVDDGGGNISVDWAGTAPPIGAGLEATALRVTLATDSTGVVSVDDNGGSLTVDVGAALPAGTNAIGKLAANSGVDIGDVDILSVVPGTGATNLGKAEDAAHATGDVGVMALSVRTNTATARAGTDGDYQPLITDTNGRLHVKLLANESVNVGQINGVTVTMGNGVSGTGVQRVTLASDSTGQVALAAGSALAGDVGLSGARTSGGTTLHKSNGTSTLTQIKATGGQLYWLHVMNLSAAVVYLQVFNLASASVTLGTTVPDLVFPVPTQGATTSGAGFVLSVPNGIAFSTGISWAITTTKGGATAATADTAFLNAGYA